MSKVCIKTNTMFSSVSYDDIVRWLATKALPVRIPTFEEGVI